MNKELIAAVNLIAEYVQNNMPGGYTLELHLSREECDQVLYGPDGEEIAVYMSGDQSTIIEACEECQNRERQVTQ